MHFVPRFQLQPSGKEHVIARPFKVKNLFLLTKTLPITSTFISANWAFLDIKQDKPFKMLII